MATITLSLISHTNVGKTTLARTLLRRDVGEVRDAAHVTDAATGYLLVESAAGDTLRLWDTPGFGDSARLLRRLEEAWRKLAASYDGLPEAEMLVPGVVGPWSVKDVVAHVTSWEEESLKHLPLVLEGRRPPRYSVAYVRDRRLQRPDGLL